MAQSFWISTGGISESYETVNVVFALVERNVLNEPVFAKSEPTKHLRSAIDALAHEAQKLGANGVLWIRFETQHSSAMGAAVLASGTAVRVRHS